MSPTTDRGPRATPLPPDERRAAIIDAVLPLLTERGRSVTSKEIATAAGVAEGTVFKVFADKEALFEAALERALDLAPLTTAIEEIDPTLPFEDRLVAAVNLIQRRIVDVWQLVSKLRTAHRPPASPKPLGQSPALTALLAREPDRLRLGPEDAAMLLRGLTLSLSHPMIAPSPMDAPAIVDLFLDGARSRP